MSSLALGKAPRDATHWDGLPREIRLLILKILMDDDSVCRLSCLATVSREWQAEVERYNFGRLRLTPSRIVDFDFGSMVHRNRALVSHIWFCLELDDYGCTKCAPPSGTTAEEWKVAYAVTDTAHCPITTAFQKLFSALSTWEPNGDLTLDISIYSPSDSKHWFKHLTFLPDTPADMVNCGVEQTVSNQVSDEHGWIAGVRHSAPPRSAIDKIFHPVMEDGPFDSEQLQLQWWDQLPSVPAITRLLLRQQNRRRWMPSSLAHMFARFPGLQEVHYEPWREWRSFQRQTDRNYEYLFESIRHFNDNLKRLVIFENFNQQYPATMHRFTDGDDIDQCHPIRNPSPAISRIIAATSLKLEHLAASFMVDARHFLNIESSWEWPNLTTLALTSRLLSPGADPGEIGAMLEKETVAAMKMPRLETMEIWNGQKGLAALFQYQVFPNRRQARITWRGTWKLTMDPSMIQAWKALVQQRYPGWEQELDALQEWLDEDVIKSHGDAVRHLMLSSQVIRPVSLQQIQLEQKALEGVITV